MKNQKKRPSRKTTAARKSGRRAKGEVEQSSSAPGRFWQWVPPGVTLVCLLLPALIVTAVTQESFRLPKLIVSEALVLGTLILLSFRLLRVERVDLRALVRSPAFLASVPFLLVATVSLATTDHPRHVVPALISLWIATAAFVGWSQGLHRREFLPLLRLFVVPSLILSLVAVGQYHEILDLFLFQGELKDRIGVTSLAGGAFDLAAYLVLPALVALVALWREHRLGWRILWGVVLLLAVYTIALTQTLSALLALALGVLVLLVHWLPKRRLVAALALFTVLGGGMVLTVEPLRERLERKVKEVSSGGLNPLLTGRLDGWRAAWWMASEHPLMGVGHGAYRAEFGVAKLALRREGVQFYRRQHQPYFVNAHSEPLEVAANGGILGVLALLFGCFQLLRALRRARGTADERALMWAGVVAITVMSLVNFPFRIALVAYPMLFFLAWIFCAADSGEQVPAVESGGEA